MDERFLNVNRYGVLRADALFWSGCMILVRFQMVFLFAFAAARRDPQVMQVFSNGIPWLAMLVEVPALFLLIAAGRRNPDAGRFLRFVWQHARWAVLTTVLGHAIWTAVYFWSFDGDPSRLDLIVLCFAVIDLAILKSFWGSDYYRQLFKEFPGRVIN